MENTANVSARLHPIIKSSHSLNRNSRSLMGGNFSQSNRSQCCFATIYNSALKLHGRYTPRIQSGVNLKGILTKEVAKTPRL